MRKRKPAAGDACWQTSTMDSAAMRLIGSLATTRAMHIPCPHCDHAKRGSWSFEMDYTKPADVVAAMIDASTKKLALAPRDLMIRGALSGALLGAATTL